MAMGSRFNVGIIQNPLRFFHKIVYRTKWLLLPKLFENSAPGPVTLGIRPEQIGISSSGDIKKKIYLVEPLGKDTLLYFETVEERELIAIVESNSSYRSGDTVALNLLPEHIFLFDSSGKRILN